jgi:hypothetical protein
MTYQISTDHTGELFIVRYTGNITYRDRQDAFLDFDKLSEQVEFKGILLDFQHSALEMSTAQLYELGETVASKAKIPIALLLNDPEILDSGKDRQAHRYYEMTLHNRGCTVKAFDSTVHACNWLLRQ